MAAAWDRDETRTLHKAHDLLHGTLFVNWDHIVRDDPTGDSSDQADVMCWTLDTMDRECGPFEDVFLWMDVEGAELRVFRGAEGLFSRGAVRGVNVESRPDLNTQIAAFLTRHGLRHVHSYFESETVRDEVWLR